MVATVAQLLKPPELSWDKDWHRIYTSVYLTFTTSKADTGLTAVNAPNIPEYGSHFQAGNDEDPWAFAIAAQARSVESDNEKFHRKWYVTITHSTQPRIRCADFQRENPIDEPPIISGSFAQFTRPAEKDRDDKPILNSAEEPFVPAIEVDDARDTLIIEVNTAEIDLQQRADARNKVNSDPIWGLDKRHVKMAQWQWRVMHFGKCNPFINNVFEFHIGDEPWNHKQLDAGFRDLNPFWVAGDPLEEKHKTIMDGRDHPRHMPTPLDGSGAILADGADAVYLKEPDGFEIYEEFDFTTIAGIPNPLPGPFA